MNDRDLLALLEYGSMLQSYLHLMCHTTDAGMRSDVAARALTTHARVGLYLNAAVSGTPMPAQEAT